MGKQLLFSLSKDCGDFVVQPFKGSGNGGQKRNKTMSGCRIVHAASNTASECQDERSFRQNKKKAFLRLLEKESFKTWHRIQTAKAMGVYDGTEEAVEAEMQNIKVEHRECGKWTT